jgi:hypothetical protein
MMNEPTRIYLFRSEGVANGSETVICAAPVDLVVATYGGGGHGEQEGVRRAFGGNAFYRNDETGECFIGVWGARNASRFRTALRCKAAIAVIHEQPPARLAWWNTGDLRPPTSA